MLKLVSLFLFRFRKEIKIVLPICETNFEFIVLNTTHYTSTDSSNGKQIMFVVQIKKKTTRKINSDVAR